MDKKIFDSLSREEQRQVLDANIELVKLGVINRMSLLPTLATLSAGLLVLINFRKDVAGLTPDIKVIISLLLILSPVALWLYNRDNKRIVEKAVARFEEWNDNPFQHTKKGFLDRLTAWMPEIFIIAISLISLYLIFCLIFLDKIWC
jgi:hypothetical protein